MCPIYRKTLALSGHTLNWTAGAQGQFWEMHDMLFTHQDRLEFDDLRRYAQAIGLDMRRFDQEMGDHVYEDEVRQDFRRGIQAQVPV